MTHTTGSTPTKIDPPTYSGLEIAVIGMAGRFPGAPSIQAFWQNLQQSVESISAIDDETLLAQGVPAETLADPNYVKVGGVVEGVDLFDAAFFGFSPREAEILDPQQRLFLETAVEALETAGYDAERYLGSVGVYGGAGMNGYLLNLYSNAATRESVSPYELFISNDKDFLTTRVSYKLNLKGPSIDVQTACSSSLVAVHMAAQALLSGECDMALAGGVAISKQLGYKVQEGSIYSPDGQCRAFDAKAAGTVSGNGVGIVVLKRLEDAITDNDTIDAIIKGSAVNNDGALKVSYTAPCVEAQATVIKSAHAMAEVSPGSISYIEAHGTGTALGDPIEISALTQAFNTQSDVAQSHTCAIGSVKTNIGHLDAASGISGFIKTALALKHKQIPASLNFQQPNPNIDFDNSPFYVNTQLTDWPQDDSPRRAGVSSFGIGGTNAHIVLEEPPATGSKQTQTRLPQVLPQLLTLSAKTPSALDLAALNLADCINNRLLETSDFTLENVAHTLQMGRRAFEYRRSIVCQTALEAVQKLHIQGSRKVFQQPSPFFLFSGQGSQHLNMAKGLSETQPVFKENLDRCANILLTEGIDLFELLYLANKSGANKSGANNSGNKPEETIQQTAYAQPALFAIEYALAKLWTHLGVRPIAMLGHSLGEYVAACLAGVFDLETALKLVCLRGSLMQKMPSGAMLSVALSTNAIKPWLSEEITLAVSNGPTLCAVSGSDAPIASLQARLEEANIGCHRLHTSHAFHSPMMEGAIAPFVAAVSKAASDGKLNVPTIPFISNVTGTWITPEDATSPDYWGRQIRQTVRFSEGIETLLQQSDPIFLEVGPGNTLTKLAKQHFQQTSPANPIAVNSLPHPKSTESDITEFLSALGQLWSAGVAVDWAAFQGEQTYRRIPLPTYPFERQRYWVDFKGVATTESNPQSKAQAAIEIKPEMEDWFYTPSWERTLSTPRKSEPTERPCWLIFIDGDKIGEQLAKTIEKSGQDVFTVYAGEGFEQSGYRKFSLNPETVEGFEQLLEDLNLRELMPTEIVYLWALPTSAASVGTEAPDSFVVLMNLFQALSRKSMVRSLQVTVVTESAYDVVGTESLNESISSQQSDVQGLCQVVSQEYPTIGCRQVDWVRGEKSPKKLAQLLWQEVQTEAPAAVVAYRSGVASANWNRYRWAQTYQSVRLTDSQKTGPTGIRLRQQGTYVVIGTQGFSEIWQSHLIEQYQANAIVIEETSVDGLSTQLQRAIEQFGAVNGIFVSSPMTNEKSAAPIALLQAHHWEYNCTTKKTVLKNLASFFQKGSANALQSPTFKDNAPDFCCVQSSLSSVIGGLGLAAYASANHFIDTFVTEQNRNSPFPWFAINWDAYSEEREIAQNNSTWSTALADFALTPTEVWQATERILTQAIPGQIIVSKGDLLARHKMWIHATPQASDLQHSQATSQITNQKNADQNGQTYSRPQLSTAYVAPRNEIEEKIAAIWQDLLGLEKVGVEDSFFDLGGHSLMAIQVISRLREAFPVDIEMRNLLFEAPTIAKIAAVISQQLPQAAEMDEMAALLAEVQTLSSEEIQAQLAGGDA